jgi:hypothetical protein
MDKHLEQYLYDLERSLKDFPPSNRAKILNEISQKIEQAREQFPDKSIESILSDLGPADRVANHYRLESGFKTFKPAKHPILKFFTIAFLGTVLITFISIGVLVWKFTPIIKIDEEKEHFMLLGGLIDIDGKSGKVKVFDQYKFVQNKYTNEFEGSFETSAQQEELLMHFSTGNITLKNSIDRNISWNCKIQYPPNEDILSIKEDNIRMNLDEFGGGSCEIAVPINFKLTVEGQEGEVTLIEPEFDAFVDINDGNIHIKHSPEVAYKYSIRLKNGTKDKFPPSSDKDDAYEIQLELKNGSITYE